MLIPFSEWYLVSILSDLQLQCFGFAICLVIMPLFVSSGLKSSNSTQVGPLCVGLFVVSHRVNSCYCFGALLLCGLRDIYSEGEKEFQVMCLY